MVVVVVVVSVGVAVMVDMVVVVFVFVVAVAVVVIVVTVVNVVVVVVGNVVAVVVVVVTVMFLVVVRGCATVVNTVAHTRAKPQRNAQLSRILAIAILSLSDSLPSSAHQRVGVHTHHRESGCARHLSVVVAVVVVVSVVVVVDVAAGASCQNRPTLAQ